MGKSEQQSERSADTTDLSAGVRHRRMTANAGLHNTLPHQSCRKARQTTDRQTDTGLERKPPPKTLPRRLQTRHNVSPSLDPHSCAVTEGGGASLRHPVSPGCRATGTGNTSLRFSCTCCARVFAPVSPFLFPVPVLLSPSHNYERMSVSFSSFFFCFNPLSSQWV